MSKEILQQRARVLGLAGFALALVGTGAFVGGFISLDIFRLICIFLGLLLIVTFITVYRAFFREQ